MTNDKPTITVTSDPKPFSRKEIFTIGKPFTISDATLAKMAAADRPPGVDVKVIAPVEPGPPGTSSAVEITGQDSIRFTLGECDMIPVDVSGEIVGAAGRVKRVALSLLGEVPGQDLADMHLGDLPVRSLTDDDGLITLTWSFVGQSHRMDVVTVHDQTSANRTVSLANVEIRRMTESAGSLFG